MDEARQRTGFFVSGAMHLALLAVLVFGFMPAPRFEDAPESIPLETISTTQLNEIMQGEKTAQPAAAKPAPAKPPPAPAPAPAPQEASAAPPPPPPSPPAKPPPPEPPRRPEPPKPPPPRPEPQKQQSEDAPSPPTRPREVAEPPRPPDRPHPPKNETAAKPFKPDEIAKTLAQRPPDDKPRKNAPAYDSAAIAKMLNPKVAEADPGLANHHAAHMSVSLENALNEWFRDSYKNCWNLPPSNPTGDNYVFDVRVTFNPDGSLAARPVMLNPPHDPGWRAHADSVMRAVMRCNPLHIPTQYAPFFDQWRSKIVHFDPSSAEG